MVYRIDPLVLKKSSSQLYTAAGLNEEDSEIMAEVLADADMRGIHSHGIVRTARYVECILSGGISASAKLTVRMDSPSFLLLDGNRAPGIPVSVRAMRMAMERARQNIVCMVGVKGSRHFGAAGYYSGMCAAQGMFGFSMSNADVLMAITGSKGRVMGNAPFSYAFPARRFGAVNYDGAMSVVAGGKIEIASRQHEKIPFGWLQDAGGNPTEDPDEYYKGGALLPFGDYKGYGLAVMVEALVGLLSGGSMLSEAKSWNTDPNLPNGVGHFFIAIDISRITSLEKFKSDADALVGRLIGASKKEEGGRIYYPGEKENDQYAQSVRLGVPLGRASVDEYRRAGKILGMSLWEFESALREED